MRALHILIVVSVFLSRAAAGELLRLPPAEELSELRQLVEQQQSQISGQAARIEQLERDVQSLPPGGGLPNEPLACLDECRECFPRFTLGGQYRLMFNGANFDFHPATITDDQPSQSFFNQRFRTWLTVKTSENVEGYIQTEIGHVGWGDDLEFPKAFVGPRFPAGTEPDRVGIELRRGYLTYTSDAGGRWRAGIQDWQDSFDQTLASSDWDFNVGGLSWLTTIPELGDMRLLAGAFVLFEGDVQEADDAILWTLDGDWETDRGDSLGWSIYAVTDHDQYSHPTAAPYDSSWDVWFGLRGTVQTAVVPLHAFFLYNTGKRNELGGAADFEHHGFAAKLGTGPAPFWFGQLRFQALYSTGEDDPTDNHSSEFRTIAQSVRDNFGAQGYWSYLAITSPHGPSDVNDLGVSLQNRGLGLFTAQVAFDYDLHECLSAVSAVGWLNSDQPNPVSGSREMGTELLEMFTYDFGGGLKADVGAAVLFTGDFYNPAPGAAGPDTLWEAFSRVQLEF